MIAIYSGNPLVDAFVSSIYVSAHQAVMTLLTFGIINVSLGATHDTHLTSLGTKNTLTISLLALQIGSIPLKTLHSFKLLGIFNALILAPQSLFTSMVSESISTIFASPIVLSQIVRLYTSTYPTFMRYAPILDILSIRYITLYSPSWLSLSLSCYPLSFLRDLSLVGFYQRAIPSPLPI